MSTLREIALVRASVPATATFADAARALSEHRLGAIAVVDARGAVVGLFTDGDLLRGVFPSYLGELHHTAFLGDDLAALAARATTCAAEPVTSHMRRDVEVLDVDASATHAAERFLHSQPAAFPVAERGLFVGMLSRAELARAILRRFAEAET